MTPFVIFFLVTTFLYVVYYAVIITIDLNSKPKGDTPEAETIETGMEDTQQEYDDTTDDPCTEQQEDQEEKQEEQQYSGQSNDIPERTYDSPANEETDNIDTTSPAPEVTTPPLYPSSETDDDIYGLGDGDENEDTPKNEESEETQDEPKEETSTEEEPPMSEAEKIAQQQGAVIVDPMEIDETDYGKQPEKEIGITKMYGPEDASSETANRLNNMGEPIQAESMTPVDGLHSESLASMLNIKRVTNITKL